MPDPSNVEPKERAANDMSVAIGLIVILALYFIPTIIAVSKGLRNAGAIFAMNLLLGWSFIGWVVALIWSLTNDAKQQVVQVQQNAYLPHPGYPGGPQQSYEPQPGYQPQPQGYPPPQPQVYPHQQQPQVEAQNQPPGVPPGPIVRRVDERTEQ